MIQRKRISVDQEREMLRSMITSSEFLKDIRTIIDTRLLVNPYSRRVAGWCLDYFDKYEEAPSGEIRLIFEGEKSSLSPDDVEYIERLLVGLNDISVAVPHRLDQAENYLKRRKLEQLADRLKIDIEKGDIASAENRIVQFERVSRPQGEGVDMFEDRDRIGRAISEREHSMMHIGGVLGDLLGNFYRGDLVAVAGPPKRGKTWWLYYLAIAALLNDMKVLVVSLEMLENQSIRRFVQMFTSTPVRSGVYKVPFFVPDGKGKYIIDYEEKAYEQMTITGWKKALTTFQHQNPKSKFRLLTFPQDTMTVHDLEVHMDNLEYYDRLFFQYPPTVAL